MFGKLTVKRVVLWIVLLALAWFAISVIRNWDTIQRVFLGGVKVYETEPPAIPSDLAGPAILVFSKTNGFRHEEAIPAANALFQSFAEDNGWGYFQTENGATFDPAILAKFDAVVFNNVSGDVFTAGQRQALTDFVTNGGGFVGIHGAGGDNSYAWDWYVNDLIGAQFIGHPMDPQFQEATVDVEDRSHPATVGLAEKWVRIDEWYSFEASVRAKPGFHVLATLDESTYSPEGPFGQELQMGEDHPIVWWHCQGAGPIQGRAIYSAIGHQASAYAEPEFRALLLGATEWALRLKGDDCGSSAAQEAPETADQ